MKQKRFTRLLALLLCLILCLSLTGCKADIGTMLALRRMAKALENVQDLSFSVSAEGRAMLSGQETTLRVNANGAAAVTPLAVSIDAEAELGGLVSLNAPLAAAMGDGVLDAYAGLELSESRPWLHVASVNVPQTDLSLSTLMTLLGGSGAAERIKGEKADREQQIRISLPGSLVSPDMQGDLVVDLWLDKESDLPTRVEMELAPLLRALLDGNTREMLDPLYLPARVTLTAVNTAPALRLPQAGDEILELSELPLPAAG